MTNLPPIRSGFEWGLAALLSGGILVIAAILWMQFTLTLEMGGFHTMPPGDLRAVAIGGYVGAGIVLVISLVGAGAGLGAMLAAARQRQPLGAGLFGLLLNLVASATWVAAGVAWHQSVHLRM